MNVASGMALGLASLAIGLAMIWFAMPDKQGEHRPFLRVGLVQMIYPVVAMLFLVIAVAQLLIAFT